MCLLCIYFLPSQEKDIINLFSSKYLKPLKEIMTMMIIPSIQPKTSILTNKGELAYGSVTLGESHSVFGTWFPYQSIMGLYNLFA